MADSLPTFALETLRDLLIEEAKFLSGVSGQVEQVQRDLKAMHCLLMDADKWSDKQNPATLRDWIRDLHELAFKAENVLEKYAAGVASKRGGDLIKRFKRYTCILRESYNIHQVGKETEAIRTRLTDLTARLKSMSPGESSSGSTEHLLRLTYPHEVEEHFVGMKKDIEHLVSLVNDDERSNRVISIYGMGGLGKTSLARKIYNHNDVQGCFEAHVWVCVTQEFRPETVLSKLLKKILPDEQKEQVNGMDHSELVEKLHTVQMQKKCLFVIDDIWQTDHWEILKPAFSSSCKVLLTTRNEKVASQECTLHKLDYLTEDEGWELLQKIALSSGNYPPAVEMEATGREIVQKCGRLPLAISVIGGILRQKPTLGEWKTVTGKIDSYLKHGEGVELNKKINQVLDLSYDALPYNLKACFLYLGCFGEDEEIDTARLYLLWIAEGLISCDDKGSNETLVDVAERYLSELAFRCMVQVKKDEYSSPYHKFESCRLHDLMRDLCLSKGEKQQFIKRIDFHRDQSIDNTVSRLALSFDGGEDDDYLNKIEKFEDLRSLLVLNKEFNIVPTTVSKDIILNFDKSKFLRILTFVNCDFRSRELPSNIGKLIHLRYLSLFNRYVKELPLSVCKLPYLHTLDLRVYGTIRLPNAICKIKRLRHLFLDEIDVTGKLILDGLKELEILEAMSDVNVCIADIHKLTNLRNLVVRVTNMNNLSIIANYMSNNPGQLRRTHLYIEDCYFNSDESSNIFTNLLMSHSLVNLAVSNCKGCIFPRYQPGMSRNLVKLFLWESDINEDVMETLGKFPMLKHLEFGSSKSNIEIICRANSFPNLKYLNLWWLSNLKILLIDEGAMPNLETLKIDRCQKLKMIPDGLRFINTLQRLEIEEMHKEFNDRLRVLTGQQGEDYHKVCHIPSVLLTHEREY